MPCSVPRGSTHGPAGVCSLPSPPAAAHPFSPSLLTSLFFSLDDHFFDALTARTCNGHPLPCSDASLCVSEADAASVFALGDFEYECVCSTLSSFFKSLTHCTAQLHLARGPKRIDVHLAYIRCASAPPLSLFREGGDLNWHSGAFFAELADALAAPAFSHRLALYVGHDGTLVRLLAGLGVVPLRWPAFGAEVVIEVRLVRTVAR